MRKRIQILVIGFILLTTFFLLIKRSQDFSFVKETEKDLVEMKIQKDSVFQMAEEITKFTENLKHANDSLNSIKQKEMTKIVEKQIVIRDTVEIVQENLVSAMRVQDDREVERLKEELQMYKFRMYNIYSERDSLLIKLNNLQTELDSLKLKK